MSNYGKGCVMTPPLVADILAAIASVDESSIVLDIACGTGELLAAATRAGAKELIGIEINNILWAQAVAKFAEPNPCAYLFNHCSITVDADFRFSPIDIALLNPPYSCKYSEWEFINKALDYLRPGGTLVALVPLSLAVSHYKKDIEWKSKILTRHTLKSVITMPLRIFPDAQTVTCVMVFVTHQPHSDQETYFAYWRNQELLKPVNSELRDKSLFWYRNGLEVPGISVIKRVNESVEWCAEAHLPNELNSATSKLIRLGDLFHIHNGTFMPLHRLVEGNVPYISSTIFNNGVVGHYDVIPNFNNVITVTNSGNPCYAFYQPYPIFASSGVLALVPKGGWELNEQNAQVICDAIASERSRFSFGRQLSKARASELIINVDKVLIT